MKKFLLGTTAVVAATAFGGAAYAQSASEPIKLGLGGYWRGAAGQLINSSGDNKNEHFNQGFVQDSIVDVKGSTKFDNGLGVGVSFQFRGISVASNGATTDTVKRSYVRFFGGFGEVRFGDDDESRLQKHITAPQAGSLFGVNSPFFAFSNNPVGTNTTSLRTGGGQKRAHRIAYFSPTIAGFSFAVSFAPDNRKGNLTSPASFGTSNNAGQGSQTWSVGALYDNKFGDFSLQLNAGFSGSRQEGSGAGDATARNDFGAWDAAAVVGWGPFKFGGSYEHVQNARVSTTGANPNQNNNTFDLGFLYTAGPFSTSLGWSRGYYRGFAQGGAGGSATSVLDIFEIVGDYVLGPGVSIGAALQYTKYRSGVPTTPSTLGVSNPTQDMHDATIAIGTAFTF